MENFKKGDIFYADLQTSSNHELSNITPVIIIQNNIANKYLKTVIIAPITSRIRHAKLSTHVPINHVDTGLNSDGVILLEQIRVLDKTKLKHRIGKSNKKILKDIEMALCISLDLIKYSSELEELRYRISQIKKPLIMTEGKTDVKLIETAWKKLYPGKEMFFKCISSGMGIDEDKREGGANSLRRTLELVANIFNKPVIGLFDNDREGNEQFKGLNKKIFEEYNIENDLRKHKGEDVWGMLLPVPNRRKLFVTEDDMEQRYFVIEHYFSDDILKKYHMYGASILGTTVFKVNNGKDNFSKEVENLNTEEFKDFHILFSRLKEIFNVKSSI